MSQLILPSRFYSELNKEHPLVRDLLGFVVFDRGQAWRLDLKRGILCTVVGSPYLTSGGLAAWASNYVEMPNTSRLSTDPLSIATYFSGESSNDWAGWISSATGSFYFGDSGGGLVAYVSRGTNNTTTTTSLTSNRFNHWLITHPGGAAAANIFRNGNSEGNGFTTTSGNAGNLRIGGTKASTKKSVFAYVAVFDKVLDAAWAPILKENWTDLVKSRRNILYFDVGGATIPTLSSPGVTNILTTSATPQVTLTF